MVLFVAYDILGNKISKNDPFGLGLESNKPNKRRPIDKNIRNVIWQKYNKNSLSGKCYVCKRPITHDYFEVGHNKAVSKGGKDNITNLRPICSNCNRAMGTMAIEQYKAKYFGKVEKPKSTKKASTGAKPKRKSKSNDVFGFGDFKPPKIKLF